MKNQKDELEESTEEVIKPEVEILPDAIREQFIDFMKQKFNIDLKANLEKFSSETREVREEIIPPTLTIGTELDKEDELTGVIKTKTDKWGFHIDYHGTKGRIFETEVPMFSYGHLGAIIPGLTHRVYKYYYQIDETGNVVKSTDGKPVIIKKERIHLGVELSNLKARMNLGEGAFARTQQGMVLIGGHGQVSPIGFDSSSRELFELAFGKREKK